MAHLLKSYWKTGIIALIIAYLSLAKPSGDMHLPNIPFVDKWIHITMYAVLTMFALLETKKRGVSTQSYIIVIASSIMYSGTIELLQQLFPPRVSSWYDFLANIVGCIIAFALYKIVFNKALR